MTSPWRHPDIFDKTVTRYLNISIALTITMNSISAWPIRSLIFIRPSSPDDFCIAADLSAECLGQFRLSVRFIRLYRVVDDDFFPDLSRFLFVDAIIAIFPQAS